MPTIRLLNVERLTEDAFAPFGQVIGMPAKKPDYEGLSGSKTWGFNFEADGRLQFSYVRVPYQRLAFHTMEQHFSVTQSFVPVGGVPAIVAVAAPTDDGVPPRVEDVRAFILDGTKGYVLKRRTWHSLDRFPLYPPHGDWLMLTDWDTTADLKASSDGLGDRLTRALDFEKRYGVVFEFDLTRVA